MDGTRLKRLRQIRGLSAQRLAARIGVSGKHIFAVENNRHRPSLPLLERAAEALSVPVSWFFLDEGREQTAAVLNQYPADLLDFLTRPEAVGYVRWAAQLAGTGVSLEAVTALVAAVKAVTKAKAEPGP